MNRVEIIEKIDPCNSNRREVELVFIIGSMNEAKVSRKLIEILNQCELIDKKGIRYKYNGFIVNIDIINIPKLIVTLVDENIKIYSVYPKYDPSNRE